MYKQMDEPLSSLASSVGPCWVREAEICQATNGKWVEIRRCLLSHRCGKRAAIGPILGAWIALMQEAVTPLAFNPW